MNGRLAKTTFSTGPADALLVVDAYKQVTSEVNNSIADISTLFNPNSLGVLKGGNLLKTDDLTKLIKSVSLKSSIVDINPEALLKGIVASNPDLVGSLKSLTTGMQEKLLSGLGKTSIAATLNGITTVLNKADLSTLSGLGSMVNSLSGANFPISFVDKSGLANLATGLIKEATALGMPNVFKAFTAGINDKNLLGSIAKNLIPDLIKGSSTNLLNDIANSPIAKNIMQQAPNFIKEFANKYIKPPGMNQEQLKIEYEVIDASFEKLKPQWKSCKRVDYEKPVDVFSLSTASKDFKSLIDIKAKFSSIVNVNTSLPALINTALNTPIEKYMALGQELLGAAKTVTKAVSTVTNVAALVSDKYLSTNKDSPVISSKNELKDTFPYSQILA